MPRIYSTRKHVNIDGRTIGDWYVVGEVPQKDGVRQRRWLCICSCGTIKVVQQSSLLHGGSNSCGHDRDRRLAEATRKHGRRRTPLYNRWAGMIRRCENPNVWCYPIYGGRGIRVADAWHDFAVFARDMGEPPFPDAQLERVDNNGHYEPSNVRWATRKEQARNTRQTRFITALGRTLPIQEWVEMYGVPSHKIRNRIDRLGWTPEEAIELIPRRASGAR